MDIGKERKEIIVVPLEEPEPVLDPVPSRDPAPKPTEPAKEPVGV
jgi:hypothetical protein